MTSLLRPSILPGHKPRDSGGAIARQLPLGQHEKWLSTLVELPTRADLAANVAAFACDRAPTPTANPTVRQYEPGSWIREVVKGDTESERSFQRLGLLKVETSRIAMHLDALWRTGLFRQLDLLLDADEWDSEDELPTEASFRTFLRMIVFLGAVSRPGLGATAKGNVIAAWTSGRDRLTVECLPNDRLRWVLSQFADGERQSAAGEIGTKSLRGALEFYHPEKWFSA